MMSPGRWFRTLHSEEPVLSAAGWLQVVFLFVMLLAAGWDRREVLGLNPWIKPMKFAASITLYLWTLGWLLRYLPPLRTKAVVRWGASLLMIGEIALISMQAARGVRSHFNTDTPSDALLFGALGLMILVNTFLALAVFFHFLWQEVDVAPAYLAGMRLGLAMFLFGSMEGMIMVLNIGHTVGGVDGGAGLPVLNWSTRFGDLRVAHAVGLHGLQLLPLAGWLVSRYGARWSRMAQTVVVMAVGIVYMAGFTLLLRQALAGQPVVRAITGLRH